MSENTSRSPALPEGGEREVRSDEKQAATDAALPSSGWNPYEVWRSRVLISHGTSYNKTRANS